MTIAEFFMRYPDELSCRGFFKSQREASHKACEQCGSLQVYWQDREDRWRCKECRYAMGLKKGTVMENSNLGYRAWLWGLYLMSLTKKGFSALEMQRLLGHSRYEPIWLMAQKIRISMGHRDSTHTLDGYIEMDEGFFEGHRKKEAVDGETQYAQELDRQVKVIVAVSTAPVGVGDQKGYCPKTRAGFIKMSVVESLCTVEVTCEAAKMIESAATVATDGRACYNGLKGYFAAHRATVIKDKTKVAKVFPWVHTAISNAKKKILGLHHQVKDGYMQNYLNEFCYKFNRRFLGAKMFDRLVIAALEKAWYQP